MCPALPNTIIITLPGPRSVLPASKPGDTTPGVLLRASSAAVPFSTHTHTNLLCCDPRIFSFRARIRSPAKIAEVFPNSPAILDAPGRVSWLSTTRLRSGAEVFQVLASSDAEPRSSACLRSCCPPRRALQFGSSRPLEEKPSMIHSSQQINQQGPAEILECHLRWKEREPGGWRAAPLCPWATLPAPAKKLQRCTGCHGSKDTDGISKQSLCFFITQKRPRI